ncbi:MAG TPA: FecR domain-containing protein [Chitinophagaceae bacterium]|nr:FecR domain-containing protein [Chitinophagaceae bacterium]
MMSYQHYSVEDFLTDESFQRYCSGTDAAAVLFWSNVLQELPELEPRFHEAVKWYQLLTAQQGNLQQQTDRLLQRIENEKQQTGKESFKGKPFYKMWWAAAVVVLVAAGGYFLLNQHPRNDFAKAKPQSVPLQNDIAPGGDKAVLTLADGSRVVLDSAANGALTRQGNVTVIKLNGQLAYNKGGASQTEVLYNTISTPRGGQYQLVLADGSKVWLNAASSLRFPTAFTGKERRVELKGEGYFEVAHDETRPFHVDVNDMDVQVLGTHFNINSYSDEDAVRTTLLEGAVKVSRGGKEQLLRPGQQAVIAEGSSEIALEKNQDMDRVISWKNGLFDFENDPLPVVMRQLSRWYDVEVKYMSAIPGGHYTGAIRRQANLSEVLKMLELAGGVHFVIEGREIAVRKKTE